MDVAAARLELVLVATAAVVAGAAVLLATGPHGPGLSPDSAAYLSAGRNLAEGAGLITYGHEDLVGFPPGFPLLLAAVAEVSGASVVTAARSANVVLLGLIVVASWLVTRRLVSSAALRVGAVSLVAAATGLHTVSSYAWSEPFFVLAVLLALLALHEAMRHPQSYGWLVTAALAASASFYVRYIGLVLIPVGCGAMLAAARNRLPIRHRALRAGVFTLIAAAGSAIWLVRNLAVSDSISGEREEPDASLAENTKDALSGVVDLIAPTALAPGVRVGLMVLLVAVLVGSLLELRAPGLRSRAPFVWLLAGFTGLYLVSLILAASISQVDLPDDRLLVPVFVPLAAVGVTVIDGAVAEWRRRGNQGRALVALATLVLCAGGLAVASVESARDFRGGNGYATERWRDSDLAEIVRRTNLPDVAYSNFPDAVFLHTSLDARCWPDELSSAPCSGFGTEVDELDRRIGTSEAALIWFLTEDGGGQEPPRLPDGLHVIRRMDTRDGAVYLLRRVPATQ